MQQKAQHSSVFSHEHIFFCLESCDERNPINRKCRMTDQNGQPCLDKDHPELSRAVHSVDYLEEVAFCVFVSPLGVF